MFKKIVMLFIVLSCFSCVKSVQTPVQPSVDVQDVSTTQLPTDCTAVQAPLDAFADTEQ